MFTTTEGLRLDLAVRTSKRKKDAKSPKQQLDMAMACIQANNYVLQTVHDSGKDESGKTMNRATLNTIMERVERGETDGMIVALADRLGRAPIEEAMAYVRRLTGVGVLVLADMGGIPINLNDPAIETNLVIQLQMARQYWLMTANRFLQSQRDAVKAGKWIGFVPFGYLREDGRLVPDPKTAHIVTEAFKIGAAGDLYAVIAYLRREVPERRWYAKEVRRLLTCRAYLGEVVMKVGPEVVRSGKDHGHVPLTTRALFEAAQPEPHVKRRRDNGDYPLSHLVSCKQCGAGLVGQLQHKKGTHYTYRRYRCANPECNGGSSIRAERLEEHVTEELVERTADREFVIQMAGADVDMARQALDLGRDAEKAYSEDAEYQAIVSREAFLAGARARAQAVASAEKAYKQACADHGRTDRLPTGERLREMSQLVRFITASRVRIAVKRGRGDIIDRVSIDPPHGDDRAGMLAA